MYATRRMGATSRMVVMSASVDASAMMAVHVAAKSWPRCPTAATSAGPPTASAATAATAHRSVARGLGGGWRPDCL